MNMNNLDKVINEWNRDLEQLERDYKVAIATGASLNYACRECFRARIEDLQNRMADINKRIDHEIEAMVARFDATHAAL